MCIRDRDKGECHHEQSHFEKVKYLPFCERTFYPFFHHSTSFLCTGAVSYTHLDVYKRQQSDSVLKLQELKRA